MEIPSFTKTYHHEVYPAIDPTRPELSAVGKIILITGGGQGIGAAFAMNFAKAGASDVIITGRKQETLSSVKSKIESLPENKTRVHTFVADTTNEARTNEVFAEVLKSIGRINVFIANAGYHHTPAVLADASIDDLWHGFEVNVKGLMIGAKAFLKSATPDAVLINVSTGAAHVRYFGPITGYASSKAAGVRVTEFIGVENPGVRVYSISPGIIATDMAVKSSQMDSGFRFDSDDLPAAFAVWLASSEAEFLKGRFLWANWDVDEMKAQKEVIAKDPNLLTLDLAGWPFEYTTDLSK